MSSPVLALCWVCSPLLSGFYLGLQNNSVKLLIILHVIGLCILPAAPGFPSHSVHLNVCIIFIC